MDLEENKNPATDLANHRLIQRILRLQIVLGLAGVPVWWIWRDWFHALSFATGAAAAIGSFWLLERFTSALGGDAAGAGLAASAVRTLLIGGALFVIITNYKLLTVPLGTGVLLTVIAITIEGIREVLYARTLDH